MTRELQLRDVEILTVFEVMILGEAPDEEDRTAAVQETIKRCDCTVARLDEALARVGANSEHLFWRTA